MNIVVLLLIFSMLVSSNCQAKTIKESLGNCVISAYSPACNTPAGSRSTSSGKRATAGRTIAVDASNPIARMGDILYVEGLGEFVVEDTGGFGKYGRDLDVFFDTPSETNSWGVRTRKVWRLRQETPAEKRSRIAREKADHEAAMQEVKDANKVAMRRNTKFKVIYEPRMNDGAILINPDDVCDGDYWIDQYTCIFGDKFYDVGFSELVPKGYIMADINKKDILIHFERSRG